MEKTFAKLYRIENNHNTDCSDHLFHFNLRIGLLLALKERGLLNDAQFRYAEACIRKKFRVYSDIREVL